MHLLLPRLLSEALKGLTSGSNENVNSSTPQMLHHEAPMSKLTSPCNIRLSRVASPRNTWLTSITSLSENIGTRPMQKYSTSAALLPNTRPQQAPPGPQKSPSELRSTTLCLALLDLMHQASQQDPSPWMQSGLSDCPSEIHANFALDMRSRWQNS